MGLPFENSGGRCRAARGICDEEKKAASHNLFDYHVLAFSEVCRGGKVRYGRLRPDTNHYLKWAFSEARNSVAVNRNRFPARHVSQLYHRIRCRKDHAEAVGAVARHLAEATYWILTKGQAYQDQAVLKVSSTGAQARCCHEPVEARGMNATPPPEDTHAAVTAKR